MSFVVTELSIPSGSFELGQILQDHSDIRIELTQFVPTSNGLIPYFWLESAEIDAFEEVVRADDRVASLTRLDGKHGKSLYRIEWAGEIDGFLSAVADHDLLIENGTGTAERWRFRLRGPDRGNMSSFHDALREKNIPIEVHTIRNPADSERDRYGLTGKQREALELAFTKGYFDEPRQTTMSELGKRLDITPQSVSRRVTRGTHQLLTETIMPE